MRLRETRKKLHAFTDYIISLTLHDKESSRKKVKVMKAFMRLPSAGHDDLMDI